MESRIHAPRVIDEVYQSKVRLYKIFFVFGFLGVVLIGSLTYSMNAGDQKGNRHPRDLEDEQTLLNFCRNRSHRLSEKIRERNEKLFETTCDLDAWKSHFNESSTKWEQQVAALNLKLENQQKQIKELMNSFDALPCPIGWQLFGGFCYKFSLKNVPYDQAAEICKKENSHLVSIHSAEENSFVSSHFTNVSTWIWTGFTLEVVNWIWSDGSVVDYTNWGNGWPQETGTKKWGHMWIQGRLWGCSPKSYAHGVVCKKKPDNHK
ncbi:unnamed protein product, partial [Mesorhabditis belari]|uniref:C-type lectin domain-containing protein n=1 Tax=Mesorhabditis belari TaxID=2138241 RepID=A0AAF3FEI4_9BILA